MKTTSGYQGRAHGSGRGNLFDGEQGRAVKKIWALVWVGGQIWAKRGNFWVILGEMEGVKKILRWMYRFFAPVGWVSSRSEVGW
jgi:hypothetical protein